MFFIFRVVWLFVLPAELPQLICIGITWELLQCKAQVSRSQVQPDNLHFQQDPTWCWCCSSEDLTWGSKEAAGQTWLRSGATSTRQASRRQSPLRTRQEDTWGTGWVEVYHLSYTTSLARGTCRSGPVRVSQATCPTMAPSDKDPCLSWEPVVLLP